VTSEAIRTRIKNECLVPLELDNFRVYEMAADGTYQRRTRSELDAPMDAQLYTWGLVVKAASSSVSALPPPVELARSAE